MFFQDNGIVDWFELLYSLFRETKKERGGMLIGFRWKVMVRIFPARYGCEISPFQSPAWRVSEI